MGALGSRGLDSCADHRVDVLTSNPSDLRTSMQPIRCPCDSWMDGLNKLATSQVALSVILVFTICKRICTMPHIWLIVSATKQHLVVLVEY